MKAVIREWLAVATCMLAVLCVVLGAAVNDLEQRIVQKDRALGNARVTFVQSCVLNDETDVECSARWDRAVKP